LIAVELLNSLHVDITLPYIRDYKSRNFGQFLKREVGGSTYTMVKEKCQF